jgi:hypothetical protein
LRTPSLQAARLSKESSAEAAPRGELSKGEFAACVSINVR